MLPIKRALLSVADKAGIVAFAQGLIALGAELISTGGTARLLAQAGIAHRTIEETTGFPGLFDGRVKTLHPMVHGGVLGQRDVHSTEAARHGIPWIDLVVVNFYHFENEAGSIDIGGPALVRAAAKNHAWVGAVVDPGDYGPLLAKLQKEGGLDGATRRHLAEKAFALTAQYDAQIHHFFMSTKGEQEEGPRPQAEEAGPARPALFPEHFTLQLDKQIGLRYGENPHQKAAAYRFKGIDGICKNDDGLLSAIQHQGKPLSYNNLLDGDAAWACVNEFTVPSCTIVKHAQPCGVASAKDIEGAFALAYQSDVRSAFGGIIALNRPCTEALAEAIAEHFFEVVIAPAFSAAALAQLAKKPNLRALSLPGPAGKGNWEMRSIQGGILVQEQDQAETSADGLQCVTKRAPSAAQMEDLMFAWRAVKHLKSNAIVLAKGRAAIAMGAGQVSRIDAIELALRKACGRAKESVMASDGFFPFRDSIDQAAAGGVSAIIQPGGAVRDKEVVAACDHHGITMVVTGKRCFRH